MSELSRVIELAELMVELRGRVDRMQSELDAATEELRRIEQEDLPELMREVGMQSVTLRDGTVIDVVDEVSCGITEANRAAAHAWLVENGFAGLIKTDVVVGFGRGEHDAAVACAEAVGGTLQERVHPSTLKAFVKEQMAAGRAIPFDLFSVHPYSKARMKAPKK